MLHAVCSCVGVFLCLSFLMAQLPAIAIIEILSLIDEPALMRAMRATSRTVEQAGELARQTVEARCNRLNGALAVVFPDLFRRLLWWSPWQQCLRIYEEPDAPAAAAARFQELWDLNMVKGRGHVFVGNSRHHQESRRVRYVVLYGNSGRSIFWYVFTPRGWTSRALVWANEMAERHQQQQQQQQ